MGLKHQAASNRKFCAAIAQVKAHFPGHLPPLFYLTDPARTPDPAASAERLPAGSGVIYRHFGADNRECTARTLSQIASDNGLFLLVSADPELAQTVKAHGVHWPEARLSEAQNWRDVFALNTASAHSARAIQRAAEAGIDAALVSPVFASKSASAGTPLGATRFRTLVQNANLPIYGLGGINADTAGKIANFAGLAAIEGIEAVFGA